MQEKPYIYEYAVIRLVPKVERGEFINIGLAILCKKEAWLRMDFHLKPKLLDCLCPQVDSAFIHKNLEAFKNIAHGEDQVSPIAKIDAAERFRWLTAIRSSIIQTSRPHVGLSEDLEETFNRLFKELVE